MIQSIWRCAAAMTAFAIVLISIGGSAEAQRQRSPLRVFEKVTRSGEAEADDSVVLRRNYVRSGLAGVMGEDTLILDLFDDLSLVAQRNVVRQKWEGPRSWVGKVPNEPNSEVSLIERDGVVAGTIRLGTRTFKIRNAGRGLHAIEEVDGSKFAQCATGSAHKITVAADTPGNVSPSAGTADLPEGVPTVDVLVVYTAAARAAAGGEASILATIDLAVLETNQAYANSGINYQLALVKAAEVNYAEVPSFSTMLSSLRNQGDGVLDEVHGLRDMYGADLVSMIVGGSQYCGLGYLMSNPGAGFQSYAFSVVARGCATGYYSFAHELGHNLGCQHDRDHAGTGAYSYSFGHRAPDSSWRTVMAYAPGPRVGHFSNPAVMLNGISTGVVNTSAGGADNAMTINTTAPIVAQFRDSPVYSFGQGKLTSQGEFAGLGWTGTTAVQQNEFGVELGNAIPEAFGILLRGHTYSPHPFHGGTLFFAPPFRRMGRMRADLDGASFKSLDISGAQPGATDYYQVVFRDAFASDGTGIGLSNSLKVTYLP